MLMLHRAERTDRLATALAGVLSEPTGDPFDPEIVAVSSRGVERWLAQRLSHRLGVSAGEDGICANVLFPSFADLMDQAGGGDGAWRPDRLVWPLLEVIDDCMPESWCRTLAAYLGAGEDDPVRHGRRYATARRLAALFDSYAAHRPGMLRAWSAGDDQDGLDGRLPDDLLWQAHLWRRLGERMDGPGPAERLESACRRLRENPATSDLPQRLSIFGLTRLPAAHADLLAALGAGRDVHVWLPHPSPALWERLRAHPADDRRRRANDLTGHPLLASLGRDVRELQTTLGPADSVHHPAAPFPDTLLGRLQQAIAADQPPPASLPVAARHDRSVQVHACHGPDRQVEVLREVILGLLASDPDLEPRDVLVMCPDIEVYAPLISASFGLGADAVHPAHRLRVRLADRALRRVNPLFGVIARLLELADGRVTAAEVLDLAAMAPVRRCFRFDDDDLDRLGELVSDSGVRWGFDAGHRARFEVPVRSNTWDAGLDRILLGVAMSEDGPHWLGTALPLDDMDSGDVDLAGRLAELVERLRGVLTGFSGRRSPGDWLAAIETTTDLLTDVPDADRWQRTQLSEVLADIGAYAPERIVLGLSDVRALLDGVLRGTPTRANFRTGDLTMCTLVPMRSVPHRVICVLGLDDGVFPRGASRDGDDVLGRDPCVGERDPRGEDRQLLLDAVMAATGTLVLLYSGADERTNTPRPPAVPLGELLDALDRTARTADGHPLREQVVTRHPLQPFDIRNFDSGVLGTAGPFSFDAIALAGARAATDARRPEPPFLPGPLAALDDETVELADLQTFFAHPVRGFARRRLGLILSSSDDEPADRLPVELDALQRWAVGDRLLRALLDGGDLGRNVQAEWRRGTVPPGPLGTRLLDSLAAEVEPLATAALTHRRSEAQAVDIAITLDDGRLLTGTIGDLHGDVLLTVAFSRIAPKHRLRAWLNLLALTVARPETAWRAVTVGRGRQGRPAQAVAGPIDPSTAARVLGDLVAIADAGLREPLPLAGKSSHAYAGCRTAGGTVDDAHAKARNEWTRFSFGGESDDAAHQLVWGPEATLDTLLAAPSSGGSEPTRFGELAVRLWRPLIGAERMEHL
ncbi:exodeoxyribonuclease V subunit gamma [Actinoplanes sp. NPDC026670]|uniref:exodeoxyribonuclease V subunit gamma n=1 Tax=Actinoplanes sp. NPDC026670 TaxID=3154700 RepID=UPI0033D1FC4C